MEPYKKKVKNRCCCESCSKPEVKHKLLVTVDQEGTILHIENGNFESGHFEASEAFLIKILKGKRCRI